MTYDNEKTPINPSQPQSPTPSPAPGKKDDKNKALADTIQALGQTNVPSNESNVFTVSIIGQIEGHVVLPP